MAGFSVEEGIKIQADNLADWKQLLRPEVYQALEMFAKKNNKKAQFGSDITRGSALTNFVVNYLKYRRNNMLIEIIGM